MGFSREVVEAAARSGLVRVDTVAIAARAGVSETTVRRVLRSERGPSPHTVALVQWACGLRPERPELPQIEGASYTDVANRLRVATSTVLRWATKAGVDHGRRGPRNRHILTPEQVEAITAARPTRGAAAPCSRCQCRTGRRRRWLCDACYQQYRRRGGGVRPPRAKDAE